ncbi:MAG: DNA gyrase inhibitor YacG [Pirellulales bacterium]|nr:DNA gyrase inhibitor YacG [Pirellulales bacterium]
MTPIRCSICGKKFDSESSAFMPFCSERCKRIDFGRWLDERYGLPCEPPEENADSPEEEA